MWFSVWFRILFLKRSTRGGRTTARRLATLCETYGRALRRRFRRHNVNARMRHVCASPRRMHRAARNDIHTRAAQCVYNVADEDSARSSLVALSRARYRADSRHATAIGCINVVVRCARARRSKFSAMLQKKRLSCRSLDKNSLAYLLIIRFNSFTYCAKERKQSMWITYISRHLFSRMQPKNSHRDSINALDCTVIVCNERDAVNALARNPLPEFPETKESARNFDDQTCRKENARRTQHFPQSINFPMTTFFVRLWHTIEKFVAARYRNVIFVLFMSICVRYDKYFITLRFQK